MPWGRHLGGYPHPIMLCNIFQNAMGQTPMGGTLPGPAVGVPCWGVPCQGSTLPEGYPARGYPGRVLSPQPGHDGGILLGGTQIGYPQARSGWGGTLPGATQVGYPPGTPPPGQVRTRWVPCRGGIQLGQQKEYSLHGGRSHRRTFL